MPQGTGRRVESETNADFSRQRTLRATTEWSCELLGEAERAVLWCLAICCLLFPVRSGGRTAILTDGVDTICTADLELHIVAVRGTDGGDLGRRRGRA